MERQTSLIIVQPTGHLCSASSKVIGAWDEWETWPWKLDVQWYWLSVCNLRNMFLECDRFQICGTTREKAIFHTCPICSGYDISLIAIANDIFRKKEVDKMSCMFRTLLRSKRFHSTGQLFIALGQNIRNLNFYSLLVSWQKIMVASKNDNTTLCHQCKNMPAEIFQENGDYCLDCWQERVYPLQ
jgi:hypothetical protein